MEHIILSLDLAKIVINFRLLRGAFAFILTINIPKKLKLPLICDILHLETPVGTAGYQYGLLTVTVPTVHAPITDGVSQDVTRTYGRN